MRRDRSLPAIAALALALAATSGRAGAAPVEIGLPIPIDAATQARCIPPDETRDRFSIVVKPFVYSSFGDYPPENDAVYFLPDTPYFHALWVDGLVRYFTQHGLTAAAGPRTSGCIHPAVRQPGDAYESGMILPGTYIMVVLVRSRPDVAELDGGLVTVAPHERGTVRPSARFFAQELDVEPNVPLKEFDHLMLVDEIP